MVKRKNSLEWVDKEVQARERILGITDSELEPLLAGFGVERQLLIERAHERATAIDRYIEKTRKMNLDSSTLRTRLIRMVLMGAVPLAIAVLLTMAVWAGVVSDSDRALAGFVLIGCVGAVLLAIAAAFHIAFDTFVHQQLLYDAANEANFQFGAATVELLRTDKVMAAGVISHFSKYHGLYVLLERFGIDKNSK